MSDIVKVGQKKKHMKIPEGWEQVKEGDCERWDRFADLSSFHFKRVEEDDIGMPFDFFDCLIRQKAEGKGAK